MDSLLIIDDDFELCAMLHEYLSAEGFKVEAVHRGDSGLARAITAEHALVILDLMLPEINGLDVLRRLRERSQVPVLLLTARGTDVDRIIGLEIGADDYLPKPFNSRELLARIRAILRRPAISQTTPILPPDSATIIVGDIALDEGSRSVARSGVNVELTATEFSVLQMLLRSAGRIVSREEMVTTVLGHSFSPFDRSLDVHVSNLRKKLGEFADGQDRIKSIRSVGYLYVKAAGKSGER